MSSVGLRAMPRFLREHRLTERRLSAFLDGELPEADARRIRAHTSRCPSCRRALKRGRRLVRLLAAAPPPTQADERRADAVIARLHAEPGWPEPRS